MQKGKFNVVFGGQAGSEAKGKQGAYLADKYNIKWFVSNLSPNAGHTWVGDKGEKVVTHHIPASIMGAWVATGSLDDVKVVIGPAAIINPDLLLHELEELKPYGFQPENLIIDARATMITDTHIEKEAEGKLSDIGSTLMGVGEARVAKVRRERVRAIAWWGDQKPFRIIEGTSHVLHNWMECYGTTLLCEASQGFDLDIDHGVHHKYCTSRQVSPMSCLADSGIPAKFLGDTYAVIRTYPIRVNNRTGTSGPYPSEELTWETVTRRSHAPHDLTEITTTTKLPRRVFEFSFHRIQRMVDVCDPTHLCLQFANYLDWGCYGAKHVKTEVVANFCRVLERITSKKVSYIGTGEKHSHMVDRGYDKWET